MKSDNFSSFRAVFVRQTNVLCLLLGLRTHDRYDVLVNAGQNTGQKELIVKNQRHVEFLLKVIFVTTTGEKAKYRYT